MLELTYFDSPAIYSFYEGPVIDFTTYCNELMLEAVERALVKRYDVSIDSYYIIEELAGLIVEKGLLKKYVIKKLSYNNVSFNRASNLEERMCIDPALEKRILAHNKNIEEKYRRR